MRVTRVGWVIVASLLGAAPLAAKSGPAQNPQPGTYRFGVDVDAVTLDVVVLDPKMRFVGGLKKEDFEVLEDGVPQELEFFTSVVTPVTVLVLLDGSASVRSSLEAIQKAAIRFVSGLRGGDQARVGYFHERIVFGPRFTDSIKEHVAMIRGMLPRGRTLLHDAVLAALKELSTIPDRKALLVFTDGDDAGSDASEEQAIDAVRRSNVAVYTVGFKGWNPEEGDDINEELLSRLAVESGGATFFAETEKGILKSFDRIQDELHRQYRMAYTPPEAAATEVWRRIEVRVAGGKGRAARTRSGYYSQVKISPQ